MRRGLSALMIAALMLMALGGAAAAHGPGMNDDMPYGGPGPGMNGGYQNGPGNGPDYGPGPHSEDPNHYYCQQTGHYLSYGFKYFWQHNGDVGVFGYPMTEEMAEHGYTVQYLERQRFEYHPEHAGTAYEVQLGRLGYEQAQHLGLMGSSAFAPLPAGIPNTASSTFFPQTGHDIAFGFRDYWMTHGLDLGDPGITMRESLALFGYPISQEFTDPATGLTVQYFERAVFEYHADNAAPYQVLLQRLGAGMLQHR